MAFAGASGVAVADDGLSGAYTLTWDLSQAAQVKNKEVRTDQWTVTPCGAGCADVAMGGGQTGQMHLVNGRWEMSRDMTLMNCNAGGPDVTVFTSLDAATLQGFQRNTNHCANVTFEGPASLARS